MSESKFENVPLTTEPHALSVEDAAARAGRAVPYFRTIMSKLNNAGRDLRTPAQKGERARRYDLDKLDAWITEGQPIPEAAPSIPKPRADARTIHARATRNTTRNTWTITMDEINQGTETENLRNAHQTAHALAVEKLGVTPDQVTVKLTPELPTDAAERWQQAKTAHDEAAAAARHAAALSRQVVHELKTQGFKYQDIGELLGISHQRAQQLAAQPEPKE